MCIRDRPSIVTVILSNFLSFWHAYIIAMTLLTDPKGPKTLPVGLMNLMKAQNAAAQYGQMYAGDVYKRQAMRCLIIR